jgi:hypothetical protein
MNNNTVSKSERLDAALEYAREGWPVLPLRGKIPLTTHGVKDATTDEAQIIAWWTRWPDANIGLATGKISGQVVLDVDVKNGKRGDESLRLLEEEYGPLPKTLKSVTASGGWHLVYRLSDCPVKSRNGVREGLDLLSDGKYFVAPPSMIDGKAYCWTESCEAAPCPAWVAALGERSSTPQDAALENRIPELIRDLFPVGKESNGNWITCCPYHGETNPSFEVKLDNGVFYCFACEVRGSFVALYAKVKNVSEEAARRIIRPIPAFVEELNREHAVIMLGGKCVILNEEEDPIHKWKTISFSSPADFKLKYENRTVRVGDNYVNAGKGWLKHRDRRQYSGLVFAPSQSVPGHYNLWQGFAITPKPGDCDLMLDHIRMNICGNNEELFRYVLGWMAQAAQEPARRPGTALVFRGKQGTGKGILCVQFGSLFGPHFIHVTHSRHLVGNFNAHLKDALVVFADEAYWAGDKSSEGALKALVTEEWLSIEYKGKDVLRVTNHVRLMIATNHDWPVPAGLEERRFCIIDVSDARMQDTAYFETLMEQWNNGGRAAFLHYLLHYDLSGINLRKLPQTDALIDTKLLTMSSAEQFWYEILVRGTIFEFDSEWRPCMKKKNFHDSYIEYAKQAGQPRRSSETVLGKTLKKLCPHVRDSYITEQGKTERAWEFGELQQCREAFDRVMNWPNHNWEPPQEPNCVLAASNPRRGPEGATSQGGPLEELSWDQFGPSDDGGRRGEGLSSTTGGRLKGGSLNNLCNLGSDFS